MKLETDFAVGQKKAASQRQEDICSEKRKEEEEKVMGFTRVMLLKAQKSSWP